MPAAPSTSTAIVSLIILAGGYATVAVLFYVIVLRPARAERRRAGDDGDGDGDGGTPSADERASKP